MNMLGRTTLVMCAVAILQAHAVRTESLSVRAAPAAPAAGAPAPPAAPVPAVPAEPAGPQYNSAPDANQARYPLPAVKGNQIGPLGGEENPLVNTIAQRPVPLSPEPFDPNHVRAADNAVVIHPGPQLGGYNHTGRYAGGNMGATAGAAAVGGAAPASKGPCCTVCPKRRDCTADMGCYSKCHRFCGQVCEIPAISGDGSPCVIGVDCGMFPKPGSSGILGDPSKGGVSGFHDQDMTKGWEGMKAPTYGTGPGEANTPELPVADWSRPPLPEIGSKANPPGQLGATGGMTGPSVDGQVVTPACCPTGDPKDCCNGLVPENPDIVDPPSPLQCCPYRCPSLMTQQILLPAGGCGSAGGVAVAVQGPQGGQQAVVIPPPVVMQMAPQSPPMKSVKPSEPQFEKVPKVAFLQIEDGPTSGAQAANLERALAAQEAARGARGNLRSNNA